MPQTLAPSGPHTSPPADREHAVAVAGLTKRYGARVAVDGLDLRVPRGRITGFVGPNGAGKTTTIRMLLGLIRPTAGDGTVLGEPLTAPHVYLPRVGALIESPAFHPGLSGRDNLRVLATLGGIRAARVLEVLDAVGLAERADDPARSYSLGMKQRLGIAAALLPDPELLLLDEPTNGLDPAGIREVRALLRQLADDGMTVLVSSHLLGEIETICDHLVLIQSGRLRFHGPVHALLQHRQTAIRAKPADRADVAVLAGLARALGLRPEQEAGAVTAAGGLDDAARLNRAAFEAGVVLAELRVDRPSLEDAFLAITADAEGAR